MGKAHLDTTYVLKFIDTAFGIVISDLEIAGFEPHIGCSLPEDVTSCPSETLLTHLLGEPMPICTIATLSLAPAANLAVPGWPSSPDVHKAVAFQHQETTS